MLMAAACVARAAWANQLQCSIASGVLAAHAQSAAYSMLYNADGDDGVAHDDPVRLFPHRIELASGSSFTLNLPAGFDIHVAAQGLRRVRFMARAPDGRYFATDMYDKTDNSRGTVYILDGYDSVQCRFTGVTPWLTHLRNPNSLAFYTDGNGAHWLYLALTDCLLRYRFTTGERAPSARPDTLATFPAYGLSYKYGGWHLTRTVVIGGNGKIYVAVGSSCNACEEKEEVRASVVEMDPDGRNQRIYARGLRNAVGLLPCGDHLIATNMGSDQLGDGRPEETVYDLKDGANYGWPYCYQYRGHVYADPEFASSPAHVNPAGVPLAFATFAAHSAPLGIEYFGGFPDRALDNFFLVALHGSTKESLRRGYRLSRIGYHARARDFMTGFQQGGKIYGRPCGILRGGDRTAPQNAFFVTDDHAGVIYVVRYVGR